MGHGGSCPAQRDQATLTVDPSGRGLCAGFGSGGPEHVSSRRRAHWQGATGCGLRQQTARESWGGVTRGSGTTPQHSRGLGLALVTGPGMAGHPQVKASFKFTECNRNDLISAPSRQLAESGEHQTQRRRECRSNLKNLKDLIIAVDLRIVLKGDGAAGETRQSSILRPPGHAQLELERVSLTCPSPTCQCTA